jgi:tetratricopeptide (TPR) repeat protein
VPTVKKISGKTAGLELAVVLLVALGVYANTLAGAFVWDDQAYVVGNAAYQQFDLRRIFLTLANGVQYLPVRDLTFALDHFLWGGNPRGFHLTNLAWYLATLVAVYLMVRELECLLGAEDAGGAGWNLSIPGWTTLLFAVHPLHAEVVAWVSCRGYLVAGFFFFASLLLFLRFLTDDRWTAAVYGASLGSFLLSVFAMPHGLILPLFLLAAAGLLPVAARRRGLQAVLPFFALAGAAFFAHKAIALQARVMSGLRPPGGWPATLAKALQIPSFYLGKLLAPQGLTAIYDERFSASFAGVRTLGGAALVVALLALAVVGWRRWPRVGLAIAWFLAALLPVLNLFPTTPMVADRYAYLPSVAAGYLTATGLVALGRWSRFLPLLVGGVLVVLLALLTVRQNAVWRSDRTLMEQAVTVSPRAVRAYEILGGIYVGEGDYARALAVYKKAHDLDPFYDTYEFLQGWLAAQRRDYPNALAALQRALARNPYSMQVLFQLGEVYEKLGDDRKAIDSYRRVLDSIEQDLRGRFRAAARERLAVLEKKVAPAP